MIDLCICNRNDILLCCRYSYGLCLYVRHQLWQVYHRKFFISLPHTHTRSPHPMLQMQCDRRHTHTQHNTHISLQTTTTPTTAEAEAAEELAKKNPCWYICEKFSKLLEEMRLVSQKQKLGNSVCLMVFAKRPMLYRYLCTLIPFSSRSYDITVTQWISIIVIDWRTNLQLIESIHEYFRIFWC